MTLGQPWLHAAGDTQGRCDRCEDSYRHLNNRLQQFFLFHLLKSKN